MIRTLLVVSMLAGVAGAEPSGCPIKSAKTEDKIALIKSKSCAVVDDLAAACSDGAKESAKLADAATEVCRATLSKDDATLFEQLAKRCDAMPKSKKAADAVDDVAGCRLKAAAFLSLSASH